ncbi:hypothetical protein [Salimicrobium flavidum]|uniref:Uncharacterized protein n=1 Tax=Salimicrobium flavidum TaxID=570947 RepID=A0A1N7J6S6_9BACI|nr:hypothetical protein [Salimicrobium flavidum]SIS45068.1 hypothetical protein SAMN05421687_10442 [Salimicrobium flavidum]
MIYIYLVLGIGIAFFLGIIPEGFGNTLLLGAILGVLAGSLHQLTRIYQWLKGERDSSASGTERRGIPVRK